MKTRCHNPNAECYPRYGGRGVTVCAEWLHDFEAFFVHVGPRPGPEYTIDRKKNKLGYEPGNVRWATRIQQARNKETNRLVTFRGETLSLAEWCERLQVPYDRTKTRLNRDWPLEEVFSNVLVPGGNPTYLEYNGRRLFLREWARELGLKWRTIERRLATEWTIGQALGFEPRLTFQAITAAKRL
jgi:hypothetical protein